MRRLCSSFKSASSALCAALACVGCRLATNDVGPDGVSAFVACCLFPLDKCPSEDQLALVKNLEKYLLRLS